MPISQKQKTFSEFFITFPKSTQNFAHFERKGQLHCSNILEVIDSEKCRYLNP